MHINSYTYCRSHWFFYEIYYFGAGLFCAVPYSLLFNFSDSAWHTDYHLPGGCIPLFFNTLNHAANHMLSGFKIGDNTITKGPYGTDIFMGSFVYNPCFSSNTNRYSFEI